MTAADRRPMPVIPPIDTLNKVHVIGICGTAMGTLAAMLHEQGRIVTGSDAMAYPPMSTWLEERGLSIRSGYAADHLDADTQLVVVGNVARRDNPESVEAHARQLPALSMPEVLRALFFPSKRVLAVTGTHGKTTTSAMASWILYATGRDPSFFIGGVTGNFRSNYRLGDGEDFVIEGDEYDTAWFDKVPKFWHYPASIATINNVEFDHADIYPDLASIMHVFTRFAEQIPETGTLWVNSDDANALACARAARATVRTFGFAEDADLRATDVEIHAEGLRARIWEQGEDRGVVELPTQGVYNLRNFLGAAGMARSIGVPVKEAMEAMRDFISVRRRQEFVGEGRGIRVFDDFAHHPSAVVETLTALRAQFPEARLHVLFEAKSNTSRRSVFQDAYVDAFALADSVTLAPPWKQDNLPAEMKLSIPKLIADLRALGVDAETRDDNAELAARALAAADAGDLIVTLSGSNFGGLAGQIVDALTER